MEMDSVKEEAMTTDTEPEQGWRMLAKIPLAMLVSAPFMLARAWLVAATWGAVLVPLGAPPIDMAAVIIAFQASTAAHMPAEPSAANADSGTLENLALTAAKQGARYTAMWAIVYGMALVWTAVLR